MSKSTLSKISVLQNHEQIEDNSDNGKRKRTQMVHAKKQGKKIFGCSQCDKEYLSFPALYTHNKQKHTEHKVTSKNSTKQNKNLPIQKMKTLLKQSVQAKYEQIERKLLMIINRSALEIIQKFKDLGLNLGKQLGKFNKSSQKRQEVKKKGIEFAQSNKLERKFFQKQDIFQQVQGKFIGISFAGDLLQTFINNKIASKLYLHLAIIQNFESYGQELVSIQKKIWTNINVDWKFLFQNYQQYQQTLKIFRQKQTK